MSYKRNRHVPSFAQLNPLQILNPNQQNCLIKLFLHCVFVLINKYTESNIGLKVLKRHLTTNSFKKRLNFTFPLLSRQILWEKYGFASKIFNKTSIYKLSKSPKYFSIKCINPSIPTLALPAGSSISTSQNHHSFLTCYC